MINTTLLELLYPAKIEEYSTTLQETPVPVIPIVTQQDLDNGHLTRYFTRLANSTELAIEIDQKQYNKLRSNPRFLTIQLQWKIKGPKETKVLNSYVYLTGVEEFNRIAVQKADEKFGGLNTVIRDYLQYWQSEV